MRNLQFDYKKNIYKFLPFVFWIVVWQIASMIVNKEMLLASPFDVIISLVELIQTVVFWQSILHSFLKIVLGFILAILVGIIFAVLSYNFAIFQALVSPIIRIIKATPVVSFIILALIWVKSANLSVLICFLMVIPIIYTNVLQGLYHTDMKLLEMANVFNMKKRNRIRYIYIPSIIPYFISACSIGLGFCWKSGIAAEVIGQPQNSIGEQLYEAKLYMMTRELFAWTFVIILVSVVFEKAVMWIIKKLQAW